MSKRRLVVVLTGAGISQESGISTFRDEGGLWENHQIQDVATPEGFDRNPELVYRFYNERRQLLPKVMPNQAHQALAELEAHLEDDLLLVTQNIDDLHERGGSEKVWHIHGELIKVRCLGVLEHVLDWKNDIHIDSECPECGSRLRPHVVWFGEVPYYTDEIHTALKEATHFCAIGTSGLVYPAAGFVSIAKIAGAHCTEINLKATGGPFDESRIGRASEQVPQWVHEMITER